MDKRKSRLTFLHDGGALVHSPDGMDSFTLDREDIEEILEANDVSTNFERGSNDDETSFQRVSNDISTIAERVLDDEETIIKRKKQTAAATASKFNLPVETPTTMVDKNIDVVRLLANQEFIANASPFGKLNNFFSVPSKVTEAINSKLGTNYSDYEVNKIAVSARFVALETKLEAEHKKRVSKIWLRFVLVCWLVSIVWLWVHYASPWRLESKPTMAIENTTTTTPGKMDVLAEVDKWETRNKFYFSGYRKGVIIKQCTCTTAAELDKYLRDHAKTQGYSFDSKQKPSM